MASGTLLIEIGANVARLQADMGKVSQTMSGAARQIDRTFSAIGTTITSALSIGSIVAMGRAALQLGDDLAKASQKFGIGGEKISVMRYQAALADVEFNDFGTAMKKLSVNIADSSKEGGDAAIAFKAMGISTRDATGKTLPLDEIFAKLANKFSGMKDGAEKVALAVALFGRSGANIIPMLNQGASGLAAMEAEAKRLGATISGENAKKLEEYNDLIKKIGMAAKATAANIMVGLVDAIRTLESTMDKSVASVFGVGKNVQKLGGVGGSWEEPKTAAPNIEAIKKATEEKKKIEDEYSKHILKLLGDQSEGLQAFYGDAAELSKIAGEEDIKRFEDWKKIEDKRIAYAQELRGTMDAIGVPDMEADMAAAMPILDEMIAKQAAMTDGMKFDEAMNVAMAYGNIALAIDTMNSSLGDTQAVLIENQSWIALYQQAWMDAHLAIADSVASLYSGMTSWISSSLQGLIKGTMTVMDVLKNLGSMMLSIITEYVAKWVVSRLFMLGMEMLFAAGQVKIASGAAALIATAWLPAAYLATVATLGGAAAEAPFALALGLAASAAVAMPMVAGTLGGGMSDAVSGGTGAMFASGTDFVPHTMPALVHQGERILTTEQNRDITDFLKTKKDGGEGPLTLNVYLSEEKLFTAMHRGARRGQLRFVMA